MAIQLEKTNEYKSYEIRLESIGGLGANLCGKILGEVGALYLGLNAASFASYGSEKKGSPVKSYIRYANPDTDIRITSPVEKPHLLGLFHERLVDKESVMAGVSDYTAVVVNTDKSCDETHKNIKLHAGDLYCIDALKISMALKTRINMVMLGALTKASGFIPLEIMEQAVKDTIGKKYPQALKSNLEGIRGGYEGVSHKRYEKSDCFAYQEYKEVVSEWGFKNAPIGGIVPTFGSTISNDLTAIREGKIPVFIKEKCINCGLCDTTCPDMTYQFVKGEYKGKPALVNLGPDYHHCKGCLRCVEICPTEAIVAGAEKEHDISKIHVRNVDLIVDKMQFEDVGANSYINAESIVDN